jgi:hypothetical protein
MCSHHAQSIEHLFCQAIEFKLPDARLAFLDEACHGEPELKMKVLRLVDAHFKAGHFLGIHDPIGRREWPLSLDDAGLSYVCELFSEILLRRPELDEAKRQLERAFHVLSHSSLAPQERWLALLRELIGICEAADITPPGSMQSSRQCREGCV